MDVFIPLHRACQYLGDHPLETSIPVLSDKPDTRDEPYLYLNTAHCGDTVDFGFSIGKNGATLLAVPALHHAKRPYDAHVLTKAEDYTHRGKEIAESLYFGDAVDYLAAWVNEDRKQAALIHDADMVLSLDILKKLPGWIRHDLFLVLESESMKQIFAARYLSERKKETQAHDPAPSLKLAVQHSADHKTDPVLSSMLGQLMQTPLQYDGSGKNFITQAKTRMALFQSL